MTPMQRCVVWQKCFGGTDGLALSMTHFSGRVTSSHFMVLGRETLAFVISVINNVVSPFWGFGKTLVKDHESCPLSDLPFLHQKVQIGTPSTCLSIHHVISTLYNSS